MSVFENNRPLLEAFRRGERSALGTVYGRYVDEVAALVRRGFLLGESGATVRGVSEPQRQVDLVQEVFLRAFAERARLSYDGLSPFRPWLLRIAKNLMIDEARRDGRLDATVSATHALDAAQPLPAAPEEELHWQTLRTATLAYCATLGAELQRFVRLRFEEGQSQADVAQALDMTRRRVRTLEDEVRAGLRKHLISKGLVEK